MTNIEIVKHGPGWIVFTRDGAAWIKFTYKPDDKTLTALRSFANYVVDDKAWRAHPARLATLLTVADKAETWESVGEHPGGDGYDGFGPGPWGNS